jgi:hypothetical protein
MPLHLQLPGTRHKSLIGTSVTAQPPGIENYTRRARKARSLEELVRVLDEFDFEELDQAESKGRFIQLHKAFTQLLIRYLAMALESTRGSLDEKIYYTSALKWMTGERRMSASKAADMVKALARSCEKYGVEVTDPAVQEAFEAAKRLRH